MILNAYKTNKIGNSLTTYKLEIDDTINLFLDFGSADLNQGDFLKETVIILTHEHLDHWDGIVQQIDLLYANKNTIKLFSTTTTKLLIQGLFNNYYSNDYKNLSVKDVNKVKELIMSINEISFEREVHLRDRLSFELFPSGHTFGSSMVYVKYNNNSLLYTSDVDYVKGDSSRQYYFPTYDPNYIVDVLLLDATSAYRLFKSTKLNEFIETTNKIKELRIKIRPEKSLIFARVLSEKQNRKVYIERDLFDYYKILYDMGYNPFKLNKIMFKTNEFRLPVNERIAILSSVDGHLKDNKIGLHIGLNDALSLIGQLKELGNTRVYLTHYSWEDIEDLRITADELGFYILKEGRTDL